MAITISTTKALIYDWPLISAFTQQTISFDVEWAGATPTAVTIESTINGTVVVFTPVKTATVGTKDSYFFDFTDILRYVLGFPPETYTVIGLSKDFTYAIKIAGSAVTTGETVELCFSIPPLTYHTHEDNIYELGAVLPIYHNGDISFYNHNVAGDYTLSLNGVDVAYTLTEGYNIVSLDYTHKTSGNMTSSGVININVVYQSPLTGAQAANIQWIDSDGKWSSWVFRKLSDNYKSANSNEIPMFAISNQYQYAKSKKIQRDITKTVNLDTIAVDATHYDQLVNIVNSPVILYNGTIWEVESGSESVAPCKQNLHFKLSLKATQNAVSY